MDKINKKLNDLKSELGDLYIDRDEYKKEAIYEVGQNEGRIQGINERNIEIAKNLLTKNMSLEDIADVTGLTIEEIKKLQEN